MATLPWTQYTEAVVGLNHPTLADTDNRALRALLTQSGYNPDANPFPGLAGPLFNVRSFGAIGDGISDDAPAIQAAITAAFAVGGGVVWCPVGVYRLVTVTNGLLLRWRPGVTVVGMGKKTILKAGDGVRVSGVAGNGVRILYNNDENITDAGIENLVIDFNGLNNLPVAGDVSGNYPAKYSRCGAEYGGGTMHFDQVWFKNAPGSHFLLVAKGAGTRARGVQVTRCRFEECGTSLVGATINDHSSIYMDADDALIAGNTFYNSSADTVATAIETHGPASVVNNEVVNYATLANLCAQVQDVAGVGFVGNIGKNVLYGARLWSAGAFVLSDVSITGNDITIRESASIAPCGILATPSQMASSLNSKQISISGNSVRLLTQAQLTVITNAISLQRFDDIHIAGNILTDFVGEAIIIQSETGGSPRTIRRISLVGNKCRGCGITSTGARKRIIAINSGTTPGTDDVDSLYISGNQLICDAPAGTVASKCIEVFGRFANGASIDANMTVGFSSAPIVGFTLGVTDAVVIHGTGIFNPTQTLIAGGGSTWYDPSTGKRYLNKSSAGTDNFAWVMEDWGAAIPTTTLHQQGSRRVNSTPTIGQPKAWLCSVSGTPGTWISEGAVLFVLTDAATIATDVNTGTYFTVILGGNRTMGVPSNPPTTGQRITHTIIQDGTGGRTLAWNAVFKNAWSDTGNTLNKRSSISHIYDGTNWNQDGAQTAYV